MCKMVGATRTIALGAQQQYCVKNKQPYPKADWDRDKKMAHNMITANSPYQVWA